MNIKKRNWAFVIYPDSLPSNWLEILQLKGLPFAISPLHDKDFNADGEVKKPHYHVIVCYSNTTTYNNVRSLSSEINGTIPQPLESITGYYRYLTHKDNPEKAQYNPEDIIHLNGFDYTSVLNSMETAKIVQDIHIIILENNFVEYSDLMNYLMNNELSEHYFVAFNRPSFFCSLLSSLRHKKN